MLYIGRIERLARILETSPKRLDALLRNPSDCFEELVLIDPAKPHKRRTVLDVRGAIRQFQERLYTKVLAPKLKPSAYSHGCEKQRSVKTNARVHLGSRYLLKADISDFYPSVHRKRIYGLFTREFRCSPDVARYCTRLCTYQQHLALGLITSPILANQILAPIDRRIGAVCEAADLRYSRFVDDITISGDFDLSRSGIAASVESILTEHGFTAHPTKWGFCDVDDGPSITGVRIWERRLDLTAEYLSSIDEQVSTIRRLAAGETVLGPYVTESQLLGRVAFAVWINPRRGRALRRKVQKLDWQSAMKRARCLGLVESKKRLIAKSNLIRQNLDTCGMPLVSPEGWNNLSRMP